MTLPPGQHAVAGFPRWGTHLHVAPPAIPTEPTVEVGGSVGRPFFIPLDELSAMPHRTIRAALHCVAGWSAVDLTWEGVPFSTFYREIVEPAVRPDAVITHLRFGGLDGYWSVACLEDALADDVLIALSLNGSPLDGDHGAPARLVSPSQYGFVSTKHLCRVEALTYEPRESNGSATRPVRVGLHLIGYHRFTRARVWHEERHRFLPAGVVRRLSPLLISPIARLSAKGSPRQPGRRDGR